MTADGPTVEGSGGTKRPAGPEPARQCPSPPKFARLADPRQQPPASAGPGAGGGGGAFETGANEVEPHQEGSSSVVAAVATEHGGEDGASSSSSSGASSASTSSTATPNAVDRPTSPLVGGRGEEEDEEAAEAVAAEEEVGAHDAQEEEAEAESEEEEEEEEAPGQPQSSQQQQSQQERGAASNGVDHWLMVQRLKGTDPSVLAHSLLQQMGLALSIPLHSMSQEALWALVRRLLTRQDDALAPRRKLPHVNQLDDVVALIQRSRRVMVLTGAGISVACGIPDFRSENGIYARLGEYGLPDPQCMFDIDFFRGNPAPFFRFARELLPGNFKPSVSHLFIRQLERQEKLLRCYTQNIDSLELVAGMDPDRLLQCHGAFETATCLHCRAKYTLEDIRAEIEAQSVPMCRRCDDPDHGVIKPDIVFFGEGLGDRFSRAIERDRPRVDLLLVMGSSLKVGPVNKIMQWLPARVPQVLINRELVGGPQAQFDVELLGDCDAVVLEICRRLGWQLPVEEAANGGVVPGAPLEADGSEPYEFAAPNRYYFVNAKRPGEEEGAGSDSDSEEESVAGSEAESEESDGKGEEGDAARVGGALKPLGAAGSAAAAAAEEGGEGATAGGVKPEPPSGAGAAAMSRGGSFAAEEEEGFLNGLEEAKEGAPLSTRSGSQSSLLQSQSQSHSHSHVQLFSPLLPPQSPAVQLEVGPAGYAYLPPLGSPMLNPSGGCGGGGGGSKQWSNMPPGPHASSQGNTPRGSPRSTPLVGGGGVENGEEGKVLGWGEEGGMDELTL